MTSPTPGSDEWLAQVQEEIIDPARRIVDTHHHLWQRAGGFSYLLEHLWADTGSGHNIEQTIFMECHASYRTEGPEHLKPLGESEFVTAIAQESAQGGEGKSRITALVGHADLGDVRLEEVLEGHVEVSKGLFRGIRHAGARDPNREALSIPGGAPEGLYADSSFRKGMAVLGRLGFTYDTWHYHHQNRDFLELARAVPETTMVLDHFGTPLGVGPYAERREEIFAVWQQDMAEIAKCPNVMAKLGGLAMPDNGFGWNLREAPPTSDEFVAAQKRYYLHTIECFGVDRCMFESNFPVDRRSLSYQVLWNGLKKMVADFTEAEKEALFSGTAERVYRL